MREVNGIIISTKRDVQELEIGGDMRWMPFSHFFVHFKFELSHFEIKINNIDYIIRFNYHKNDDLEEMLG